MRPVPRRWATSWREPISESRFDPAATPRTGSSPFPVYVYATPKWLNWLRPCHVACLERSTERSNSTLNDCNGRVLSSLASRGRLRHSDGGRRARLLTDPERQLIASVARGWRSFVVRESSERRILFNYYSTSATRALSILLSLMYALTCRQILLLVISNSADIPLNFRKRCSCTRAHRFINYSSWNKNTFL